MGRPSKQKQIVDKYFKKNLQKRGKLDCHECIYCCQTFAYNSWRMAKHLLSCTKTSIEFKNCDMPIIQKLFKNHKGATSNDTDTMIYNDDDDENFTSNDGLSNEQSSEKSSSCISSFSSKSGNLLKNNTIEKYVDKFINQKEEVRFK